MKNDKSDPVSYSVVFHFIVACLNLVFALFVGFELPQISMSLFFFLLAAVVWGGCSIFVFKAMQLIEASEITIISSLRILVAIAGALIFLGEAFTLQKIIGTIIILSSVFIVTNNKKSVSF